MLGADSSESVKGNLALAPELLGHDDVYSLPDCISGIYFYHDRYSCVSADSYDDWF